MNRRGVIRLSRRRMLQGLLATTTFGLATKYGTAHAFTFDTSKATSEEHPTSEQNPNAPYLIGGGSCGAAQMRQLNTAPCRQGFSSHQSPLQLVGDSCRCIRCGRSVPAGNPFP
jgi:hypothetical protein